MIGGPHRHPHVPFDSALWKGRFRIGKLDRSEYRESGPIPIIDQGQEPIAGYTSRTDLQYDGPLPVVVFGDHTRVMKLVERPFVAGADGTKILIPDREQVDPHFFYYALKAIALPSRGYNRHYAVLREQTIPKPSLDEQQRIARILSTIEASSKAVARKADAARSTHQALVFQLISTALETSEACSLDTVFKLSSGRARPTAMSPNATPDAQFPVYGGNGIMGYASEALISEDTIVIGRVGQYCGSVYRTSGPSWVSDNALYAKAFLVEVDLDYLAAALKTLQLNGYQARSAQPLVTQGTIGPLRIPMPVRDRQERMAAALRTSERAERAALDEAKRIEGVFRSALAHLIGAAP